MTSKTAFTITNNMVGINLVAIDRDITHAFATFDQAVILVDTFATREELTLSQLDTFGEHDILDELEILWNQTSFSSGEDDRDREVLVG